MKNFMLKILQDQINPDVPAGGAKAPPADPVVPKPVVEPAAAPAVEAPADDKFDELGYEKEPKAAEGKEKPATDPAPKDPAQEPKKVENPGTGYGEEPPKVEELPPDPKADEPKPEADEVDKAIGELPKEELGKVKEFATKHKLTLDQVKAYGELRRQELKDAQTYAERRKREYENEKIKTRATWHKELKEDVDFGGEKFAANIQRAERVFEDFLPQTKKALTGKGTTLPPYLMRDLAKLADTLYATDKLVQGEKQTPAEVKEPIDEALDFYNS